MSLKLCDIQKLTNLIAIAPLFIALHKCFKYMYNTILS